jgi:hypothetical protein
MVFIERTSVPTKGTDALNLNIRYQESVTVDFKNRRIGSCLFVMDDLLNNVYTSGHVGDLFTKGRHHRNINVLLITQNIFHQAKHCGDISLNAKYLILFENVRNRRQFSRLAQQV